MRNTRDRLRFGWILAITFAAFVAGPPPAHAQDADCDGIEDVSDNCLDNFNPEQTDIDGDLAGDRCDSDKDADGVDNEFDTCPKDANPTQTDTDGDSVGDACDQCAEVPNDVVNRHGCSIDQLCPCDGPDDDLAWKSHGKYLKCVKKKARNFRIKELITSDERRAIVIAAKENTCGTPLPVEGDNDGDGILDGDDNCPSDSNPSQRNTDADDFGDACDADKDDDTVLNESDSCPLVANAAGQADDADADTVGDACDVCSETTAPADVDRDGCSLDQHCPCELDEDGNPWKSHGKYKRCYYDEVFRFRLLDIITGDEADALKAAASANDCGDRPPTCE